VWGMKYVALLRGIGPGNPNMRNEKLREVFDGLGFTNVQTVISSGNVIFESNEKIVAKLESVIEQAIHLHLGFTSSTIIQSHEQLQQLVKTNPFKDLIHSNSSYLLVTFFKHPTKLELSVPYQPNDKTYKFIYATNRHICSVTDNTRVKTTDLMSWMEKQFSKEITSRTWKTVNRILDKMNS
jgi:uncharacterized protein (DUF1697 family)